MIGPVVRVIRLNNVGDSPQLMEAIIAIITAAAVEICILIHSVLVVCLMVQAMCR